jgi:hypothetical protein
VAGADKDLELWPPSPRPEPAEACRRFGLDIAQNGIALDRPGRWAGQIAFTDSWVTSPSTSSSPTIRRISETSSRDGVRTTYFNQKQRFNYGLGFRLTHLRHRPRRVRREPRVGGPRWRPIRSKFTRVDGSFVLRFAQHLLRDLRRLWLASTSSYVRQLALELTARSAACDGTSPAVTPDLTRERGTLHATTDWRGYRPCT